MTKLTEKQKRFIDYYIETGNATEAAKLTRYKSKNANRIGSENLSKLGEHIRVKLKELDSKRIADAHRYDASYHLMMGRVKHNEKTLA